MLTNLDKIRKAKDSLEAMSFDCAVPYRVLRNINKLKALLASEIEAGQEEQKKFIEKYSGSIQDGSVVVDDDKIGAYLQEWGQALTDEFELEYECIDISEYAEHVLFSDLVSTEELEEFINFGE